MKYSLEKGIILKNMPLGICKIYIKFLQELDKMTAFDTFDGMYVYVLVILEYINLLLC